MPTTKLHCSLDYHPLKGEKLDTFSHGVLAGIYDNTATFDTPPLTKIAFEALVNGYHDAYEAYKNGGKGQKGAYVIARANMMAGLDTTASYVDELPGLNEGIILLAGFTPTKSGDTKSVVPGAPDIEKIENGPKGTLIATCKAVPGAEYYGCLVTDKPFDTSVFMTDGVFNPTGWGDNFRLILTKGRKKTVNNLNSKTEYFFYFFAGNSAGVSQFGVGMSLVCQ